MTHLRLCTISGAILMLSIACTLAYLTAALLSIRKTIRNAHRNTSARRAYWTGRLTRTTHHPKNHPTGGPP
jgi:hypothetical protein